jgi:two-component system nitrogen regulation response regulator NtrX
MQCLRQFSDFFTHSPGVRLFDDRQFVRALELFDGEAQKAPERRHREYARYHAATCCYVLGQYPRAKRDLILANKWAGKADDRPLRMACVFTLATLEVAMGNHEKGLGIFEKFRALYESRLEPYDRSMLLLNVALTHLRLKQLDEAAQLLDKAQDFARRARDLHLDTYVHYYRSLLLQRQGDQVGALEHLERAAALAEQGGDPYDQARCQWQLGNHWLRRERFDNALKALKKAIRVSKQAGFKVEAAKCLNDYAWAYFKKGRLTEAKSYAEEAILTGREAGVDTANYLDTLEQINAHINDFYEEEKLIAELERETAREFELVGYSDGIIQLADAIRTFAPCNDPVLIYGETGTGKELVAHAVHITSARRDRPFIKRNCAAIPENLMESELFGHVKGSFTGATTDRKGIFEEANGGTLFLDEIGEMPPSLQSKLLRVLENGEFYRVGSSELVRVDVRLIAATNRMLVAEMHKGNFREDLFFRLNTIKLDLPPLRDRKEDISVLVNHFLFGLNEEFDKYYKVLSEDALQTLEAYAFPGNVRELKNIIRAAYLTSKGRMISSADVSRFFQSGMPVQVRQAAQALPQAAPPLEHHLEEEAEAFHDALAEEDEGRVVPFATTELVEKASLKDYVLAAEKRHLLGVLKHCDSVNKACAVLQISRPTFYQKLKVHGISLSNKRLV